nr:Intraflagellar transport protein 46 [Polyrhizophydium stewartii]
MSSFARSAVAAAAKDDDPEEAERLLQSLLDSQLQDGSMTQPVIAQQTRQILEQTHHRSAEADAVPAAEAPESLRQDDLDSPGFHDADRAAKAGTDERGSASIHAVQRDFNETPSPVMPRQEEIGSRIEPAFADESLGHALAGTRSQAGLGSQEDLSAGLDADTQEPSATTQSRAAAPANQTMHLLPAASRSASASPPSTPSSPRPSTEEDAGHRAQLPVPRSSASQNSNEEVAALLLFIDSFQPESTELELGSCLKCFIPDLIPAIGDIDPFIKARFSGMRLARRSAHRILTVLHTRLAVADYHAAVDLALRAFALDSGTAKAGQVRSIEMHGSVPPAKHVDRWIASVKKVHEDSLRTATALDSLPCDIEALMAEWPTKINNVLSNDEITLPSADMDLSLPMMTQLLCNLLDIPVLAGSAVKDGRASRSALVRSASAMFLLFCEFRRSQHFGGRS